jgi:prophage regulatory protein
MSGYQYPLTLRNVRIFTMPKITARDVQLAERFQVTRQTIWRWARTGVIPKPFKIGGSSRWDVEAVEKHLSENGGASNERL